MKKNSVKNVYSTDLGLPQLNIWMTTSASTHNVTLQVLVALCIGMQLNITVSEQLLALRGYALSKRNPIHNAYRYLIERCSGISIDDANELLTELFAGKGAVLDRILLGSRGYRQGSDK